MAGQKNGPRIHGGQVALVLSRCESLVGGRTAGWAVGRRNEASGEDGRDLTAVPRRSKQQRLGVAPMPGPPNCFPSAECARCCF